MTASVDVATPSCSHNTQPLSLSRSIKSLSCAGLALSAMAGVDGASKDTLMRYRTRDSGHLPKHLGPGFGTLEGAVSQRYFDALAPAPAVALGGRHLRQTAAREVVTSTLIGCPSSGLSAPVTVGGQHFMAVADTGSWAFAVVSSDCIGCNISPAYTPSKTATISGVPVLTSYGKGNWSGELVGDTVSFASGPMQHLNFGAINATSDFFEPYVCNQSAFAAPATVRNQGLMGLAPNPTAPADNMGSYIAKVFNATGHAAYGIAVCQSGGQFYTGGIPATVNASALFYTPLANASESVYVAAPVSAASLGGVDLGFTLKNLGWSMMDTGTGLWVLPPPQFAALTSAVSNATRGVFDATFFDNPGCKTLVGTTPAQVDAIAPQVSITFSTPGAPDGDTHYMAYPATSSYLDAQPDGLGNTVVCSMVGSSPNWTIFGASMMRNIVLEYDYDNHRIGIAPSRNVC